jgi:hypothetical protein
VASREKIALLRVRAVALRERAAALEERFTELPVRACISDLMKGIDAELEWLDQFGATTPLPRMKTFLPGTTAAVPLLEEVLERLGTHARLHELLEVAEFAQALNAAGAESTARQARRRTTLAGPSPSRRPPSGSKSIG